MSQILSGPEKSEPRLAGLLRRAGIDRAVGFMVLGRVWTALSGLASLILMTRCLSPSQQGFYFTFTNVLALAVFFELGLCLILMQFASHDRASLEWTSTGTLEGDATAKARLASLLQMSLKVYGGIGLLFIVIVLPLGLYFFGRHGNPGFAWQIPWIWIVLVTGASLALMSTLAVLEGCGLIAEIAQLQMCQNIAGSLLLWLALTTHCGLYAAPVTNTVALVGSLVWIGLNKRAFVVDLLRTPKRQAGVLWRTEIWPLQWKIALSCVSGFFVFQLFNPILFYTQGAAAAGRMGLSLTVMMTVGGVAMSWVGAKSATFGTLIAKKDYSALDQLFFPCLWRSLALVSTGTGLVWLVGLAVHLSGLPASYRILPPLPLGFLALATVANHIVGAEALYLRAHKREPFLVLSTVSAGLTGISALLLAQRFGATGMMWGYLVVAVLGLCLGSWVFSKCRRRWHE